MKNNRARLTGYSGTCLCHQPRQRQEDSCKFEVSVVYIVISRPTTTMSKTLTPRKVGAGNVAKLVEYLSVVHKTLGSVASTEKAGCGR